MDWALLGAIAALIVASCYLLDWLVSRKEEEKEKCVIIRWFAYLDDFNYLEAIRRANVFCNALFDKVYGPKHLSWRCFGVSCYVSLAAAFLLTLAAAALGFLSGWDRVPDILILMLSANIWIDYLALIKTRIVLRYMSQVRLLLLPLLLLADLFLSGAFYLFGTECIGDVICLFCPHFFRVAEDYSLGQLLHVALIWHPPHVDASVVFYSTFSASAFFYLYCLAALSFKVVRLSKTRAMVILEKLEDSDHLFTAIAGFVSACILIPKSFSALLGFMPV